MEGIEHLSHPAHDHILTFVKLRENFESLYCDGCCEEINGSFYICTDCQFCLHKSCTELPRQIIHPLHLHPLTLLDENILEFHFICNGCRDYFEGFTYGCKFCQFNLDIKCFLSMADNSSLQDVQELEEWKKESAIFHFSHTHMLSQCNVAKLYEVACCCCKKFICGAAYCCIYCDFFMHISCVEIPKEIPHPFHWQHHLLASPMQVNESRDCKACNQLITGISLSCWICYFHLHVSCVNPFTRALKHECHNHSLFYFMDESSESLKCRICHERCQDSFYRCLECNSNFHVECIPLPCVLKHDECHQHPLMLFDSLKVVYDCEEYRCDICEQEGNTEHHAYYCDECKFIAHIECVIPEVRINFTFTYMYNN